MSAKFLDKISSYLFIFNLCISLQLICPCANFHFILFHFILFFIFTCSKFSIVFILSLDPFLADLPVLCLPGNARGLWFSDVSKGRGMEILVIFGSINDGLIWLMAFPVYTLWGRRTACASRVFSGYIEWKRWPEMGLAQETNIGNKSEDTSLKKICSTEKDEKVL